MSEDVTIANPAAPNRAVPIALLSAAVVLVLAGTMALWAHYGTAVFFEMVRSGFVACFG
jgi:hypothetical protein